MSQCRCLKAKNSTERCPHPAKFGDFCGKHKGCEKTFTEATSRSTNRLNRSNAVSSSTNRSNRRNSSNKQNTVPTKPSGSNPLAQAFQSGSIGQFLSPTDLGRLARVNKRTQFAARYDLVAQKLEHAVRQYGNSLGRMFLVKKGEMLIKESGNRYFVIDGYHNGSRETERYNRFFRHLDDEPILTVTKDFYIIDPANPEVARAKELPFTFGGNRIYLPEPWLSRYTMSTPQFNEENPNIVRNGTLDAGAVLYTYRLNNKGHGPLNCGAGIDIVVLSSTTHPERAGSAYARWDDGRVANTFTSRRDVMYKEFGTQTHRKDICEDIIKNPNSVVSSTDYDGDVLYFMTKETLQHLFDQEYQRRMVM